MVILRKKVRGVSGRALEEFAGRAQRAARLKGEVHVLVTGSEELRRLNRRFRRKDRPTDVLSFSALHPGSAGDIAISADLGATNARRFGHRPADELKILILHGMLHLAGYDHESDRGEMARREERLRRTLGLPAALIARSQAPPRRAARTRRKP